MVALKTQKEVDIMSVIGDSPKGGKRRSLPSLLPVVSGWQVSVFATVFYAPYFWRR